MLDRRLRINRDLYGTKLRQSIGVPKYFPTLRFFVRDGIGSLHDPSSLKSPPVIGAA